MKTFDKRNIKLWTQLFKQWLSTKFEAIATAIANIDLSPISDDIADVKSDVAEVKTAVENIDFTPLAKDATVAKQGDNPNATNTAILAAFGNIDFSTLAKQGSNADATLTAILEALTGGDEPSPDIPEGVAERLAMIQEHFGIKTISGYSFGTPTEIIDELKDIMGAIDQETTLPNSVTIDGTTYSGTSNS